MASNLLLHFLSRQLPVSSTRLLLSSSLEEIAQPDARQKPFISCDLSCLSRFLTSKDPTDPSANITGIFILFSPKELFKKHGKEAFPIRFNVCKILNECAAPAHLIDRKSVV